jgi:cell wall-associated NlpC family hydrolase
MVSKYFLISLILFSTHLFADSPKKETSLFLEYEREASQQADSSADESNPFKKMMKTITPMKPKTPFVNVPIMPVLVSAPASPQKPPIGHDDHPYLIINKPVLTSIDSGKSCPDSTVSRNDPQTENAPKKSLFSNLSSAKERVLTKAKEFLGTPYGFGNKDSEQTDCSGFTQQVYKQFGITLPHSAAEQARLGTDVDRADLQVGDLLFYQTYKSEPSHVAIYAGDGQIIHASYRNRRVQYDTIDKGYYQQRFMYAKRIALSTQDSSSE